MVSNVFVLRDLIVKICTTVVPCTTYLIAKTEDAAFCTFFLFWLRCFRTTSMIKDVIKGYNTWNISHEASIRTILKKIWFCFHLITINDF